MSEEAKGRVKSKFITLEGKGWRIDKANPLDGSNILRMLTSAGNSNPQEFLSSMPMEQFKWIQSVLLSCVYRMEGEVAIPILLPSGAVNKDAEESTTLFMLTVLALMFNVSGFFEENTLKEFQEVVKEFNV